VCVSRFIYLSQEFIYGGNDKSKTYFKFLKVRRTIKPVLSLYIKKTIISKAIQCLKFQYLLLTNIYKFDVHYSGMRQTKNKIPYRVIKI
jgi:hypothetical protein